MVRDIVSLLLQSVSTAVSVIALIREYNKSRRTN